MMTLRSVLALSVAAGTVAPWIATGPSARAGINTGAYVSRTELGGTFTSDADYGTTYGSYSATLPGTNASLTWLEASSAFSGTCSGSSTLTARSQGVSLVTLATDATFSIEFSMAQLVREGNQIGWSLYDVNAGETAYGVSFDGTTAAATGGVAEQADGTFTANAAAGQYFLVMLAECTATGGSFSYAATFTAVPGPGAAAALLFLGCPIPRRRRQR
jgi:hypothetical protein